MAAQHFVKRARHVIRHLASLSAVETCVAAAVAAEHLPVLPAAKTCPSALNIGASGSQTARRSNEATGALRTQNCACFEQYSCNCPRRPWKNNI